LSVFIKEQKLNIMNNQKLILAIIFATFFISLSSWAQENQNEYTSIFNKKKDKRIEHGGYEAFGFRYTTIDGKDAAQMSFRGA
jgi:hypothetical protein